MKHALVTLVLLTLALPLFAAEGNGAPSGPHYNLNIIGVQKNKTAEMTGDQGARIFVPLAGSTQILLCNSSDPDSSCYGMDFTVLDANGTDGKAKFALPEPDATNTGTSSYSVYMRALGKPGGSATMTTCAVDPLTLETVCSEAVLNIERGKGKSSFENVTKHLLYVYADLDLDGILERAPLFSDQLQDFFWQYDNKGLKLAQLRFYPNVQTTVQ